MRIRKMKSVDVKLYDSTTVKLKTAGNTQVVQFTAGNNKTCTVRNLSKDTYLDTKTGEVKQKKKSENRYQSPKSVRKSINRLMDLIRCNATEPAKCKWITVTYADAMTEGKQAFLDAKLFLRKLKRYLAKQSEFTDGQKTFWYITVAEPQGESHGNSWHLHILLIFEDDSAKPVTVEKIVDGVSKQFIKGERLKYYPVGMNLYSSSRGMNKPVVEEMANVEAMERIGDAELVYRETYAIGDKEKGNLIDKRYYKKTSDNKGQ